MGGLFQGLLVKNPSFAQGTLNAVRSVHKGCIAWNPQQCFPIRLRLFGVEKFRTRFSGHLYSRLMWNRPKVERPGLFDTHREGGLTED